MVDLASHGESLPDSRCAGCPVESWVPLHGGTGLWRSGSCGGTASLTYWHSTIPARDAFASMRSGRGKPGPVRHIPSAPDKICAAKSLPRQTRGAGRTGALRSVEVRLSFSRSMLQMRHHACGGLSSGTPPRQIAAAARRPPELRPPRSSPFHGLGR
jgi:hypothetical protein